MTERPITLLCQPWRSKNFKRFAKQSYVSNFDCSSLSEEFSALRLIQDGADLSVYEWISDSARRRKANRWRNVWRSNDTGLSRLSASAAQPLSTAHNEAQRDDRPRNPTRTSNLHGAFSNLVIRPGRDKIWSLVCDVAGQLWGGERVCATSCFNDIISSFSRPLSVTQTIPYTKSYPYWWIKMYIFRPNQYSLRKRGHVDILFSSPLSIPQLLKSTFVNRCLFQFA